MIKSPLAIVEFPAGRQHPVCLSAEAGWLFVGDSGPGAQALERLLDSMANPDAYGPADGDPVACAAAAAARLLGGTVTFVRPPDPVPHDAVF